MINPNIPFNLRCRSAILTSCMSRQLTFLFFISLGLERSDPIRPLFSFFLFTSGKVGLKPSGLDEPFLSLSLVLLSSFSFLFFFSRFCLVSGLIGPFLLFLSSSFSFFSYLWAWLGFFFFFSCHFLFLSFRFFPLSPVRPFLVLFLLLRPNRALLSSFFSFSLRLGWFYFDPIISILSILFEVWIWYCT